MKSWREKVDPSIKDHLEVQVAEAAKHKEAYKEADDPANAQLWCALANLSKQITELSMRMKYLENAVKQALPRARIETQEDRDLLKRMIGVEKMLEKSKPTKKGKALKKTLKKY
ncbi:MAG: hypothetical protein ABIH63_01440 [archaeon]